jgi:hypothetical protein
MAGTAGLQVPRRKFMRPRRPLLTASAVTLALLMSAAPVRAQSVRPWAVTLQGGVAFPLEKPGDVNLKTGAGFGATISYRVYRQLSAYAGWGWHRFVVTWPARPFAGDARELVETGYVFGARLDHPLNPTGTISAVALAGGTLEHLEAENDTGVTENTGHGGGWEAGVGVGMSPAPRWELLPMMKVRMLSRDLTIDAIKRTTRVSYLTGELGVRYWF